MIFKIHSINKLLLKKDQFWNLDSLHKLMKNPKYALQKIVMKYLKNTQKPKEMMLKQKKLH